MRLRNPSVEQTRQELLDAGLALLARKGVGLGMRNIPVTAAAKAAGRTTGAVYQIWKSQPAFHRDLALEAARRQRSVDATVLVTSAVTVLERGGSVEELIGVAADAYLDHLVTSPNFSVAVNIWGAAADDPELQDALRTGYSGFQETFKEIYAGLLDHYGLRMKAPHTIDDLTTSFTALAEGFALRRRVDPQSCRASSDRRLGTFATALWMMVQAMTEQNPVD